MIANNHENEISSRGTRRDQFFKLFLRRDETEPQKFKNVHD
jgi:hypothetical protein